jgi:hypothetical protein
MCSMVRSCCEQLDWFSPSPGHVKMRKSGSGSAYGMCVTSSSCNLRFRGRDLAKLRASPRDLRLLAKILHIIKTLRNLVVGLF